MTDPVQFPSRTDTFQLPLLFTGQAQKEFFINQAFSQIDAMLTGAVEGEFDVPPPDAADGTAYIVGPGAQEGWFGKDGDIALRISGTWQFVAPKSGLRLFDRAIGCVRIFRDGWSDPASALPATGGATVDTEARSAIDGILGAMRNAGILAV